MNFHKKYVEQKLSDWITKIRDEEYIMLNNVVNELCKEFADKTGITKDVIDSVATVFANERSNRHLPGDNTILAQARFECDVTRFEQDHPGWTRPDINE